MIILSFVLLLIVAGLWRLGGWDKAKWAGYRDVLIPIINLFYFWFTMDWITGILTGGATNAIRMGYGAYDPEHDDKPSWLAKVTKDREGWKIRMIYGAITSFAIGLFPTIHMAFFYYNMFVPEAIYMFIGYILINVASEYLLNTTKVKTNVWIVEPLTGASRALVFFLCR